MSAVEAMQAGSESPAPRSRASSAKPAGTLRIILRNPLGVVSLAWLAIVVAVAFAGPRIAPFPPNKVDLLHVSSGWTWKHLLGTDSLGRDVLSRLVIGALPGIEGVLVALAVYTLIGIPLGIMAGYYRGWFDTVVGRAMDIVMSLPGTILLLVVLAVFAHSQNAAMMALGVLAAPGLIRVTRAVTYSVREELYISAARVFGLSDLRILALHVWPRIRTTAIVQMALFSGAALAVQSGLAFLGFGPQPPDPSWGGMIGDAATEIFTDPFGIVPPGIAIGVTIAALGLVGTAARDASAAGWSRPQTDLLRKSAKPVEPADAEKHADDGALISVRDLNVEVVAGLFHRRLVRSVDLDIQRGETIGVVGESGCGKTLTTLGLIGALPPGTRVTKGTVTLEGRDLMTMPSAERDRVRGRRIGYVSQEPMRALDPMFTVASQLGEAVERHQGLRGAARRQRVLELLGTVKLPDPQAIARKYPHQLSGGMAQRVSIALALAGTPNLLVADEPTTALDVTTQAEILALLRDLQAQTGMATLLVTHDWGVVASLCEKVVVMYAGEVVETGLVAEIFTRPKHPYTAALLRSNPHVVLDKGIASRGSGGDIPKLPTIAGEVPVPGSWGDGCAFRNRCAYATPECAATSIPLLEVGSEHTARCIHHERVTLEVSHVEA